MDIQYPVFTVDISSTGEIGAASFSRYTVQLHRMYSMTFFTVYTPYDLQGPDRVGALWGQLSHWYRHRPRGFFPPAGHVAALNAAILFNVFEESPKVLSHRLFELHADSPRGQQVMDPSPSPGQVLFQLADDLRASCRQMSCLNRICARPSSWMVSFRGFLYTNIWKMERGS